LSLKVKDITSGYRLCKYSVIKKVLPKIKARNHEYYVEFLLWANKYGAKMIEVPIHFKVRKTGKSKLRWLPSAYGYVKLLLKALKIRFS
jgi:dolichol-phosphate mannosyltransferase